MGTLAVVTALAALAAAGDAGGQEQAKEPAHSAEWNVMDFGAVPDGVTDNTDAFQRALDAAGEARGGVVRVPTGRYSFDGSLRFPMEVALAGVHEYVPAHAGIRDNTDEKPEYGSVLMPRADAGNEAGTPFVTLSSNSVLRGVCVWYPDQKPDADEPTPYPWTVAMRGNNPAVIDVELLNPYNGIDATRNQRHLVRNVHGQPIHIGIFVDAIYDIGRLENIHWNPWWSMGTGVYKWQVENGIGFLFGKSDWQYVLNTFCFGYNVGYKFIKTDSGSMNGNLLGIGADDCYTSLVVEEANLYGLLITNGEFVSFRGPDPTMVRVEGSHTGVVRFNNCAFWGPCNRNAVVDGDGIVGFSDCTFVEWGRRDKEAHAIRAEGGSLLVRGCTFRADGPQVYLGEGVARAIVSENLVAGAPRVTNNAEGETVVKDNLGS